MRETADVVVIGGGPAGIAAATAAAEAGRRVVLVDEGLRAGGQIWRHRDRRTVARAVRRRLERFDASGASALFAGSVVDLTPERVALLEVDGRALELEAEAVILCMGARERFVPFPGWTLPRAVGVGGAQALFKAGMRVAGLRVVVAGSGPLLLPVAAALARAGARLLLVAEQAPAARVAAFAARLWRSPARLVDAARYRAAFVRTPYRTGTWVAAAHGQGRVESVTLASAHGRPETLPCDLLAVGYGLVPATELARHVGCTVRDGAIVVDALQRCSIPGLFCAGEAAGVAGADAALTQGEIAGRAAAGAEVSSRLLLKRDAQLRFAQQLEAAFALRDELRALAQPDTIVCRCEDVRRAALEPCASFREARLHTRAGMGPCQGRVCGAAAEVLFGWTDVSVRPPVAPTLVATLAGNDH